MSEYVSKAIANPFALLNSSSLSFSYFYFNFCEDWNIVTNEKFYTGKYTPQYGLGVAY